MNSNSVVTVTGTGRVGRSLGSVTVNCPAFGVVQGTGELDLGLVLHNGFLRPGGADSAGVLTIKGMVTNAAPANAAIEIDIGGCNEGEYDRLVVGTNTTAAGVPGRLHAGGALVVRLLDGFQPVRNDTFQILSFVSFTGAFDRLDLPGNPIHWDTTQLPVTGELRYIGPSGTLIILK